MTDATNLFDKTIAVSITFGSIYGQRKTSLSDVTVDADKDRLNMTAKILQCDELKAIRSRFNKTREEITDAKKGLTLPTLLKKGVFLIPMAKVGDVEAKLTAAREELGALVDSLIAVYDARIDEDRQRLRSKFDARHYPSKSALRDTFTISWRYLQLSPASQLQTISSELYQKEVARVKAECSELGEHIKQVLRGAALELVKAMHDRLGNNDDGTPKVFRNSTVNNLVQFLDTFEARNVMNDTELAETLTEVRALLKGVDADALRNNEGLRQAVATKTEAIIGELDGLITVQARIVELPEDDEVMA